MLQRQDLKALAGFVKRKGLEISGQQTSLSLSPVLPTSVNLDVSPAISELVACPALPCARDSNPAELNMLSREVLGVILLL